MVFLKPNQVQHDCGSIVINKGKLKIRAMILVILLLIWNIHTKQNVVRYNFSCNTNRLTINSVFSLPCVCISRCNQLSFLLLYNQTHLTPGALLLQIQRVYNVVEANNENDKNKVFCKEKKGDYDNCGMYV